MSNEQIPFDRREVRRFLQALADGVPGSPALTTWLTVGEKHVLAELENDLDSAGSGLFMLRFLLGNPGAGKSHLLRTLAHRARGRNYIVSYCSHDIQAKIAFNRPDQIYRAILSSMLLPDGAAGEPVTIILDKWADLVLPAVRQRRTMALIYKMGEVGLLPDAKVMHPRTRVALLGYLIATERSQQDERTLFARCLSGDEISSSAVISSLLGLGVERAYIGYTPSRYDTSYYFGQLSVLLFLARLTGFAGTLIVVDEAAAIADLRSTSRRKAYKVLDEIIKNSFNFSSLCLVIAYLPALFTQLNADCADFGLDYQLRWLDVLRDRVLEVEPLTKSDLLTLFNRIGTLHAYAYGEEARDRTAEAHRLISESILHRWSTRTFVRTTLNMLDTGSK